MAAAAAALSAAGAADGVVIASYNVGNYLLAAAAGAAGIPPKPATEIAAVVAVVKEIDPDILGLCEIGGAAELADLRRRLDGAGVAFADQELVEAADTERRLALLSKFPIVARRSVADLRFELNGSEQRVGRGFLDVEVAVTPGYRLRLVGVHLKSRRAVPEDEALLRRHEAHLLRRHLEKILAADPASNLVVYGDFNDYKNEPAMREIIGPPGTADYLADIPVADRCGERWTHHWRAADVYARLDYFLASRGLLPELDRGRSGVYRGDRWAVASDHRPIMLAVRPEREAGR